MKRPLLVLLGLILAAITFSGIARIQLETDILALLPKATPGLKEIGTLNKNLSNEREAYLLIETDTPFTEADNQALQTLVADLQQLPKTAAARIVDAALTSEADRLSFISTLAYLHLNKSPEAFQSFLDNSLSAEGLSSAALDALDTISGSVDQVEILKASYDPVGLADLPIVAWQSETALDLAKVADNARLIIISADPSLDSYSSRDLWVKSLQAEVQTFLTSHSQQNPAAQNWITGLSGSPTFSAEIGTSMEKDMSGTAGIAGILVVLLFYSFQRSFRQLLAVGVCLIATCLITLGLYGWVFQEMSLVAAGFAAILMGLVIDYAMIMSREIGAYGSVAVARQHTWRGIIWAAATTAATFAVLMLSALPGGQQLGFLVSIGLFIGAVIMLWVYPRLGFGAGKTSLPAMPILPLPRRKVASILLVTLASLTVMGFYFTPLPRISFDLKELQPKNSPAHASYQRLQAIAPSRGDKNIYIVADQNAAAQPKYDTLRNKLDALVSDGTAVDYMLPQRVLPESLDFKKNLQSVLPLIPEMKAGLLTGLDDAGLTDDAAALFGQVLDRWSAWSDTSAEEAFSEARQNAILSSSTIITKTDRIALGGLKLTNLLTAETHSTITALGQPGLKFISWQMLRYDIMPLFQADVTRVALPMIVVLLLAVWIALRTLRESVIGIIILIASMAASVLAVTLFLPEWNFLSVVGFPLLLGAGLDYTLHLTFSLRRERGNLAAVFRSTGLAVVFCALSTIIGFASLMTASNDAIKDLGLVVSIGIATIAFFTVSILPGLSQRSAYRKEMERAKALEQAPHS